MRRLNTKVYFTALIVSSLLFFVSCGKKDDRPNPAPAPAPVGPAPAPAPAPAAPPVVNGTNCPITVGGMPLNQQNTPYYGSLQNEYSYNGSAANSLTLMFGLTQYADFTRPVQNISGSGSFSFPDLQMVSPLPPGASTNICLTSNQMNNLAAVNGTYNSYDQSIFIVLRGTVPYQYYPVNPYTNQPGYGNPNPQTGQDVVEVTIGHRCPARLINGRIMGCIDVRIGTNSYSRPMLYQSR